MNSSIDSQGIYPLGSPFGNIASAWWVDLDAHFEQLDPSLLTTSEIKRGRRMVNSRDARRFLASRHALRTLLASYIGCVAERVGYQRTESGKPKIRNANVEFSLSRSQGYALVACSKQMPVGADIEVIRPVPERDSLIGSTFNDAEKLAFQSALAEDKDEMFLRTWVRKEACLKATGLGLSSSPSRAVVGAGPGTVEVCIRDRRNLWRVRVASIESPTSTAAAFAMAHPD